MLSHYILIRRDLAPGLQLAYCVHASGESVSRRVPAGTRAVVLGVPDEGALKVYGDALVHDEIEHTPIVENGELFSIGLAPSADTGRIQRLLSSLPLAG